MKPNTLLFLVLGALGALVYFFTRKPAAASTGKTPVGTSNTGLVRPDVIEKARGVYEVIRNSSAKDTADLVTAGATAGLGFFNAVKSLFPSKAASVAATAASSDYALSAQELSDFNASVMSAMGPGATDYVRDFAVNDVASAAAGWDSAAGDVWMDQFWDDFSLATNT